LLRHDLAQIAVHVLGHNAQRHFAQSRKVAFPEKIFCRPFCAFAEVNQFLAGFFMLMMHLPEWLNVSERCRWVATLPKSPAMM
jgi:hypothetical protein